MCAHYTLFIDNDELQEIVRAVEEKTNQPQQLEMYPKYSGPVLVTTANNALQVEAMQWGYPLRPRGKQGQLLKEKAVQNTRIETARTNRFWNTSYTRRRCLIPAGGFDEWQHNPDGTKTLYTFFMPNTMLYIAGIYEYKAGKPYYSMLTTLPNADVKDTHDRMPLVLAPNDIETWLHGEYDTLADCSHIHLSRKPTT